MCATLFQYLCIFVSLSHPAATQIIRRLLQFGIPGLDHPQVEPFFHGLLQRMTAVLAALEQHQRAALQASSGGAGTKDGQDGMVEELQDLAERMAGAAVDAQKEHPIGFRRYGTVPYQYYQHVIPSYMSYPGILLLFKEKSERT